MDFGFAEIFQILGALAFFIYGMKIMSDGIQRAAGNQLRDILRTMTRNRYLGAITGFITTIIVQSSSATTVMTVSFVNAGLLSLSESAGVMMGANVGTTITGWIVAILGFEIKLNTLSIPLFAFGVPMLFSQKGKIKYWGEFIVGFAILFLGLSYLKHAVPDIKGNPEVLSWLSAFTEWGIFSRLFFVLVGTMVTVIVQSSSAAMAITLTMCANGWLPFEVAAAMILGENIGTTITAQIASLVGNVNAKRSARIHSMFNVFGVVWMVFLLPFVLDLLAELMMYMGKEDPFKSANDMPTALALFHTMFNLANVILLIGFVDLLVRAAVWSVKSKGGEDDQLRLKFINIGGRTPELSTVALQKETAHFGEVVSRMSGFIRELMNSTDAKRQKKLLKKIKKYEEIADSMEIEIAEYITRLSNEEITSETSLKLRNVLNICNDLERIADVYYQISKTMEKKIEDRTYFLPDQRNNINEMIELVDKAFEVMNKNLSNPKYDTVVPTEALKIEDEINSFRNSLRKENLKNISKKDHNVKTAMVYNNIFSSLEKVGDSIVSVTESITGEV